MQWFLSQNNETATNWNWSTFGWEWMFFCTQNLKKKSEIICFRNKKKYYSELYVLFQFIVCKETGSKPSFVHAHPKIRSSQSHLKRSQQICVRSNRWFIILRELRLTRIGLRSKRLFIQQTHLRKSENVFIRFYWFGNVSSQWFKW